MQKLIAKSQQNNAIPIKEARTSKNQSLEKDIYRIEENITVCEDVLREWKLKLEDPSLLYSKEELTKIFAEVARLTDMIEGMYVDWIGLEESKKSIQLK